MRKVLWLDTETTGLDPEKNSIIQVAGIIEVDGVMKDSFDLKCRPIVGTEIDQYALEVHGYTEEEIMSWPDLEVLRRALCSKLDEYVDRFNKTDKLIPAGQNVDFDLAMLDNLFRSCNDPYLGSYIDNRQRLDLLHLVKPLRILGYINTENIRLETLAEYFGVNIDAHDALSDIHASRDIFKKVIRTYLKPLDDFRKEAV